MRYAGFWRRLPAVVVDLVILIAVTKFASYVLFAFDTSFSDAVTITLATGEGGQVGFGIDVDPLGTFIFSTLAWLYFAVQESSTAGATLGKRLLRVRVTDRDGGRISFGRATGRHFAKLISIAILYIGFIMAGFTAKKQALHDMIAGCLVIKAT